MEGIDMGVRIACLNPTEDQLPHLELITLRPGAKDRCVFTCDSWYEVYTHFIGGRTLPCVEDGCAGCKAHRKSRYEAFASVVWMHNRRHQILRLTENAMRCLKSAIPDGISPRGYCATIERRSTRANGRLVAYLEENSVPRERLPEAPPLPLHLSRIWRIDGLEVAADDGLYIAQLSEFVQAAAAATEAKHAS